MVHVIHTGVKSEPRLPISADQCREVVARFEGVIEQRPNYQPDGPKALVLRYPACDHRCSTCYMACAIAPERLAWWRNELALAEAVEGGAMLQHEGALFLEAAGRA